MKLKTHIKLICFSMAVAIIFASASLMVAYLWNSLKINTVSSAAGINRQTVVALDNILDLLNEASLAPVLDPTIYNILRKDYSSEENRLRLYLDRDAITDHIYSNVYYRNRTIYGITLLPYNTQAASFKNRGGHSPNLTNLEEQTWYRYLLDSGQDYCVFSLPIDEMYSQWGPFLCLARILREATTGKPLALIRVDVQLKDLNDLWFSALLSPNTLLVVTDDLGRTIYSSLDECDLPLPPAKENSLVLAGNGYQMAQQTSTAYGYTLTALTPDSFIYQNGTGTMLAICLAALLFIGVAFVVAEILSSRIMVPIRDLSRCMKTVRSGDLSVRSATKVGGEFGEVCRSFNAMVDDTEKLIERIYTEEKEKRKAEFQALQAQISPHFLLNTLNTIKWMAYLQGNKSIEASLGNLAKMLSFTIRDSRDKITVDTELQQLGYYGNILSIRYPNRFQIHFQVDPDVRRCLTLKYMLQPFLENSVFHGFDGLEREGIIAISIRLDDGGKLVYDLYDNGLGMNAEQVYALLHKKMGSHKEGMNQIGVYNVAKRIQLVYGAEYGVKIDSVPGEYTKVRIVIPAEYEIEEEETK